MEKVYIGIDTSNNKLSGVVIDSNNKIIVSESVVFKKSPINKVKILISNLLEKIDNAKYMVSSVGVTGDYRKVIGNFLGANILNVVESLSYGSSAMNEEVDVVLKGEMDDVVLVYLSNSGIDDYSINSLDKEWSNIKELVGRNVMLTGDMIMNEGVRKYLCRNNSVYIDNDNIVSSVGVAIYARDKGREVTINKEKLDTKLDVYESSCVKCENGCRMVSVYRGETFVNSWGNKCEVGRVRG